MSLSPKESNNMNITSGRKEKEERKLKNISHGRRKQRNA
jgi:hypothetical protein